MRAQEFVTEYRDRMYQYLKSIVPTWPDYIVKDWLYANFARGATQGPGWSFDTTGKDIPNILKDMGLSVDTKWQLVPDMKFTMDMWEPKTLKRLQARAGGNTKSADPDVHIPANDAERHATQAALAQKQGGVRKEPVILIKTAQGYELLEGWHRTIQHFAMYPQGYTGPAYVAVAQGQQGVAEAFDNPYKTKTEKSEYGDVDMLARLPDGTNLSIMFNNQGDDEWQVEFYRNNSQEVTGEGDAQRVFATVLTAMQKFIKKYKPWRLTFSANKDVEPGQNSESRAKLYNRLVDRYAAAWGYDAYNEDHGDQITYELTRLKQDVGEGQDKAQAVRRIQKMLNNRFDANLDVDGVLGPLTQKSINRFMPGARPAPADDPSRTTAVQGRQQKNPSQEEQLDELSFLGSECTKDCSGHRAGYEWSKRRGLRQANSWSPSFNKGAGLAVAGK